MSRTRRPRSWGPPSWPDKTFQPSTFPRRRVHNPEEVGEWLAAARKADPKSPFHLLADRVLSKP